MSLQKSYYNLLRLTAIIILGVSPYLIHAQYAKKKLNLEGEFYFDSENYNEAAKFYDQSVDIKPDLASLYNLGVSLEKMDSTNLAIDAYESAVSYAKTDVERSVIFFNMGNTLMGNQQQVSIENLEQAIEYYKSAIRYNQENHPAMHNLTIAQITLDMMKQQQQQQQEQQQQEQQENQDQQEQQDQQDQQEQDQNQEQQENQQEQQQNEDQEQSGEEEKKEVDKNEIENILKMVEKEDSEVQKKMRKQSKSDNTEKKKKW